MPRPLKAWYDKRSKRWYCRLGEVSDATGKRRNLLLRHEDGTPIAGGEGTSVAAAIQRRLADLHAAESRRAGPTVGDVLTGYIAWQEAQGSRDRTILGHVYQLKRFGDFVHQGTAYRHRTAASIDLADLTRIRRAMIERGCQTGTIRLLYASVLACWNWAARPVEDREPTRLIPTNPFAGLKRPSKGKATPKYLAPEAVDALLAFARERTASIHPNGRRQDRLRVLALRMIALSGCRPHEAAGLEWGEVKWAERIAEIPPERSKTKRVRRIDLRPELIAELQALRDEPTAHPRWVFAVQEDEAEYGPPARRLSVWFTRLRAQAIRAGVALPPTCSLYWLRHSWQCEALRHSSIEDVAEAAGNSPQIIASVYTHTQPATVRAVGDKVAEARERASRERS